MFWVLLLAVDTVGFRLQVPTSLSGWGSVDSLVITAFSLLNLYAMLCPAPQLSSGLCEAEEQIVQQA